ncbi:MAG: hypothetical protein Phog2KO_36250 [Phototrophicaceae bacterium]
MTVDIYDAEAQDIPAIIDLIKEVISKNKAKSVEQIMKRLYTQSAFEKTLESDNRHLIVAIIDDTIAGVCQYGIPIMDDCDCEDLRTIHSLFIHPDYEHNDIASALIYDVEETINTDAGVQRLSVFVDEKDIPLIKFYASLDFIHDQVEDIDNEWYMEKDL